MIPLSLIQLIVIVLMKFAILAKSSLHSKLHHFEILTSSHIKVRVKRSISNGKLTSKQVSFSAMGQNFNLDLKPGSPVVDPEDFEAKGVDANGNTEKVDVDLDAFYVGTMNDNQEAVVDASYVDGVWSAQIHAQDDHYFVEPLRKHDIFGHRGAMIVYRSKDVKTHTISRSNQNFLNDSFKTVSLEVENNAFRTANWSRFADRLPSWKNNIRTRSQRKKLRHRRRSMFPYLYCDMNAIVDTYAYRGFGNSSLHKTASMIIYWYQLSNRIFSTTDFGNFYGTGIRLRAITILKEFSNPQGHIHYNMESKTLRLMDIVVSLTFDKELSKYCVSHMTSQRFHQGNILGLAITGNDPYGKGYGKEPFWSGGICASEYGLSYNVGVSTVGTENSILMDAMYLIVMTHEIGHSWGAQHDPDNVPECSPNENQGGKFIMHPMLNQAKSKNNFKFSPCSRLFIDKVLLAKAHKCFYPAKSVRSFCGNGLLEPDEECDEGIGRTSRCCTDRCRLRDGALCSETSSPCCTKDCKVAPSTQRCFNSERRLCHEQAYCSGTDATSCPRPAPRPNGAACVGHGTCWQGQCLSFCENKARLSEPPVQLVDCTCEGDTINVCTLCCREQGKQECKPMFRDSFLDDVQCWYGTCLEGKCSSHLRNDIFSIHLRLKRLRALEKRFWVKNLVFLIIALSTAVYIIPAYIVYRSDLKRAEEERRVSGQRNCSPIRVSRAIQTSLSFTPSSTNVEKTGN